MKIPPVRYATSTGGTRLAYVVFGQGPNLVVTGHGMFGLEDELGDEMGGAYFEALGTRFRVAYFDPRGVGLSARDAPISVEQDADDCLAIADAAECVTSLSSAAARAARVPSPRRRDPRTALAR